MLCRVPRVNLLLHDRVLATFLNQFVASLPWLIYLLMPNLITNSRFCVHHSHNFIHFVMQLLICRAFFRDNWALSFLMGLIRLIFKDIFGRLKLRDERGEAGN